MRTRRRGSNIGKCWPEIGWEIFRAKPCTKTALKGSAASAPRLGFAMSQQKCEVNVRFCCGPKRNISRKLSFPYARFVFLRHSHDHGYPELPAISSPSGRLLDITYRFKRTYWSCCRAGSLRLFIFCDRTDQGGQPNGLWEILS